MTHSKDKRNATCCLWEGSTSEQARLGSSSVGMALGAQRAAEHGPALCLGSSGDRQPPRMC